MLAGYITATHVILARVRERRGQIHLYDQRTYVSREFSDFDALLGLYLRQIKAKPEEVVLGVAGPVIHHEVRTTNLPWHLASADMEKRFDFSRVRLVNDLVAAAHGLFFLDQEKFYTINKGVPDRAGNLGLIAAGYGLGEAIIAYDGARYRPFGSEGGHTGFAPANQAEVELWEYIYSQQGYVEVEDVLSLPGIERLYRFMVERNRGVIADWFKKAPSKADAVIEKALSASDDLAVKAIEMFIQCYARECANLALKAMTLGGLHLVGQIAPRILTLLDQSSFINSFVIEGKMKNLLSSIPVKVVLDANAALVGAAAMAISHKR
jgi:glucokinase